MVYELSLDYAGRPGFTADYTRIGVYVGVLVQQYASTSPGPTSTGRTSVRLRRRWCEPRHHDPDRRDAVHAAGRGAMIDDIRLTGTPGVVAGNAASGTLTSVALDTFVSGPLVDGDGSETLTLTFSGLPSGAVIVTAANPGGYGLGRSHHHLRRRAGVGAAAVQLLGDRPPQRGRDRHRDGRCQRIDRQRHHARTRRAARSSRAATWAATG